MSTDAILNFFLTRPALLLIIILGLTALYIIIRILKSFTGPLKYGRVISADHANWRETKSIYSRRYNLAGKPDYVVNSREGIIPIEVKSSSTPRYGPYESHKLQLMAYCLLLEEKYGTPPPFGVIQYGDGHQIKIKYTPQLKQDLINIMQEMRSLTLPRGWHPDPHRCRNCSLREKCNMAVT